MERNLSDEMAERDAAAYGKNRRAALAVKPATAMRFYCHGCHEKVTMSAPSSRAPQCSGCQRWMVPMPHLRLVRLNADGTLTCLLAGLGRFSGEAFA